MTAPTGRQNSHNTRQAAAARDRAKQVAYLVASGAARNVKQAAAQLGVTAATAYHYPTQYPLEWQAGWAAGDRAWWSARAAATATNGDTQRAPARVAAMSPDVHCHQKGARAGQVTPCNGVACGCGGRCETARSSGEPLVTTSDPADRRDGCECGARAGTTTRTPGRGHGRPNDHE